MATPRDVIPVSTRDLLLALLKGGDPHALAARLREALGAPHVALLGSARACLLVLLQEVASRAPAAEVLLWSYNFFAVPDMVRLAGLVPVPLDAADDTGEPDPRAAERAITSRTGAILVSHHFGRPATMAAWRSLAERRGLLLIEDCAHAFGASIDGRSVGLHGLGGAFSLSLTKGLTGVAGGVLVTADAAVGARAAAIDVPAETGPVARAIVSAALGKGLLGRVPYAMLHVPNRAAAALGVDPIDALMTEPAAPPAAPESLLRALHPACARVALAHLPSVAGEVALRRRLARRIVGARPWRRLSMPAWEEDRASTWLNLVVRTEDPPALRRHLLRAGFDSRPDYLGSIAVDAAQSPVASSLARRGLYLPIRALRGEADADALITALDRYEAGSRPGPGRG